MMARKLSVVARHARLMLVALAGMAFAQDARAEGEVRVTKPGVVLPNPFAPGAQQEWVAVEAGAPHRGPVTYHNPFPNIASAPPINMSMLPGPLSRWRRQEPPDALSTVKTAILSTDPTKPLRPNWDQLPPAEQLIAGRERQEPAPLAADDASSPQAGSTIRFAPHSLAQPTWFAEPRAAIRPIPAPGDGPASSPVATQEAFDVPLVEAAQSQPAAPQDIPQLIPTVSPVTAAGPPQQADLLPLVISDYADSPEGWFTEAQHLAQTAKSIEDLTTIIELCQRALSDGPPDQLAVPLRRLAGWAHNRCGELHVEGGQHAEALRNFQIAAAFDPTSSLAIHNRAVTLAQQNDVESALRDFNRVIELNPGLSVAYRNRAELLASLGRAGEAVRDYTRAIEGLPDDPHLYQARGAAWQRLGDFPKAIADLDRAIQLAPESADAYTQRGNLTAEQGNFDQAMTDLHQALAVDPLWSEAYRSLAWLHATCPDARFRNAQQAIAAAEQALKLAGPADCFVLDALAAAQASAGQFDEAVRTQQQAIAAAPADFSEPLRERLNLYQQGQAYLTTPTGQIQPVSHESQ